MKKNGPTSLGGVIEGVIKSIKKSSATRDEVSRAWRKAAGKRASKHTEPKAIKKGKLVVGVDSSAWLYALTLRKKKILERMRGALRKHAIKDIRFRIGEVGKRAV